MIKRTTQEEIARLLEEFPAVGLLGPRQVGKTTLAEEIAASIHPAPVYLDLESPAALSRLNEAEDYFETNRDRKQGNFCCWGQLHLNC